MNTKKAIAIAWSSNLKTYMKTSNEGLKPTKENCDKSNISYEWNNESLELDLCFNLTSKQCSVGTYLKWMLFQEFIKQIKEIFNMLQPIHLKITCWSDICIHALLIGHGKKC